ncbi:MAG: Spx/MgsR family RNA polymerase-binding regulatory protein, partial [Proteobacteria bacterium]|nr:Spx/MgsR family RNA polymerase-binding regulatory protein [Pseudomonadota bacterium]
MLMMYGLKNCDTCRKARKWLDGEEIAHAFVDVRADGVTPANIAKWAAAAGVDTLLNRRGTTWRGLTEAEKANAAGKGALTLMATHPALIKRPVFEAEGEIVVGFGAAEMQRL